MIIRFAFLSDPCYATDDPECTGGTYPETGFQVDNIVVRSGGDVIFSDNADGEQLMVASGFGSWNAILKRFTNATVLGMTATPKSKDTTNTYRYFKKPVYTYSLKQGIEDGFLAPYIIHEVKLDSDAKPYFPKKDEQDINGKLLEKEKVIFQNSQVKNFYPLKSKFGEGSVEIK